MAYESITREMIEALDDEIAAMKKDGGGQQVALQAGVKKGFVAGRYLYSFVLVFEVAVLDDTPAQLKVGSQSYNATVVTIEGFELTIALTQDLGERIPAANLSMAPYYLLELLKKRLEEVLAGELRADKLMALRVFNMEPNQPMPAGPPVDFGPLEGPGPNLEQRRAIEMALSQRITYIWGPPGTGKTMTLKYLVPALVKLGDRVFITSHTNVAVDAVLRAAMKGFDEAELLNGAVVRIGQPRDSKDERIAMIALDAVVERRSVELKRLKQVVEEQLQAARLEHERWVRWDRELKDLSALTQRLGQAQSHLKQEEERRSGLNRQIETVRRELNILEQRLAEAKTAGWFKRVFQGFDPERIARELQVKQSEVRRVEADLANRASGIATASRSFQELQEAVSTRHTTMVKNGPIPTTAKVSEELSRTSAEVKRLEKELVAIQAQLAAVAAAVIKEAKVVGATLSKLATTAELYRSNFGTVIIDEASMIPQPHIWFAGSLATSRVVVLGDFRQLPPITVAEDSSVARRRMGVDVFFETGIVAKTGQVQRNDRRLAILQTQYRMRAEIGQLANELIYKADGNQLLHSAPETETAPGTLVSPESGFPLVLCDTSGANPWCARLDGTYSRYNLYSALVAIRIAKDAVTANPNIRVGIMAPYSAQARLIQTLAKQYELIEQVQVATVHRFQGNEKDVILVDLVDGPPFPPGQLLKDDKARRLLNVAFTRAKGKLVLISNFGYFDGRKTGEALDLTHEYFGRHARAMDSRNILADYGDEELLKLDQRLRAGRGLGNPEGASVFNESTFYPAFAQDLETAERQVIMFTPFLRTNRTAQMAPLIRRLVDRGVEVHLLTRAESGSEDSERQRLIRELQSLGVKVTPRKGLHEKLAFIDERVAWTGSLNILSQSHSTEQMLRFTNQELVVRLLEFSGVGGLLRQRKRQEQREDLLQRLWQVLQPYMTVPVCPGCGRSMVLRTASAGPFFGCPGFPECKRTVNIPRPTLKVAVDDMDIPCPRCGQGKMRLKWSAKGPFLSCDRYPEDKTTMSL